MAEGCLERAALLLTACDWTQFRYGPAHTGFNPTETKISPANVGTLVEAWTTTGGAFKYSSPAVANGVVYVGSFDRKLYAFDAAGATGCSGAPKTCTPLWTATTGGAIYSSSPAVANGVVYVGSDDGKLYAFDAAGATGCSGTPKTCTPLWTATIGGEVRTSPAIANGVVYISGEQQNVSGLLYAFDAAGVTNCAPVIPDVTTCQPLWTARQSGFVAASSPAVAKGVVYVSWHTPPDFAVGSGVSAFDAAGITNCSGTPKTCDALWADAVTAPILGETPPVSSPVIANGAVYVNAGAIYKFALP